MHETGMSSASRMPRLGHLTPFPACPPTGAFLTHAKAPGLPRAPRESHSVGRGSVPGPLFSVPCL